MTRKNATLGVGLGVLASLGVASYLSGRRAVPSWSGTLRLAGLQAPVEVTRDKFGVPAIWAESEHDLFLVQGYLHASDRMFQLDLFRRLAWGRLAEVVGEPGIKSDRLMRVMGFPKLMEDELELLSQPSRDAIDRYGDGVNAYLQQTRRRLPVEFRLLGYRPERWKAQHSLSATRLLAFSLCGNWESELVRAEVAAHFGEDVLGAVDADADARAGFAAQVDEGVLGELVGAARDATAAFGSGPGLGSNNWVIGPRRTASHGALLANDPHLDLTLPSVWYEVVLRCPTFEARGFSIPGVPGVVLGHNDRVAWGFTNSSADVQDLYYEQVDEAAGTYRDTDGSDKPLETRTERIKVKGRADEIVTVRGTRRGPLITDSVKHRVAQPISIRFDAVRPARIADCVMGMCRAQGWEEFRESLKLWTCPAQNVVYADVEGNIGFQHAGIVPIRKSGNGTVPQRGDDPEAEWIGDIPFDEMPWAFNPAGDRIVTANDRIVNDDFPHFISVEWMNGYRGDRIRQLIDDGDAHTVARQVEIQRDVHSIPGSELQALLRKLSPRPKHDGGRELLHALENWDCELRPDDDGAIAYRLLLRSLQEQVYGFLGELLPNFLGYSRHDMGGYWCLFGRSTPRLLHDMCEDRRELLEVGAAVAGRRSANGSGGANTPEPLQGWAPSASWGELLERAVEQAGQRFVGLAPDELRVDSSTPQHTVSKSPLDRLVPRRRRFHRLRLQHPLGVVPGLSTVANHGPFPVGGDQDTVWQASSFNNPQNEWAMVGPSHRHVVDLADLDNSVAIVCGGQSGHPASPHYIDQVKLWRAGESRPAPWSREALERIARYHQRFEPS